MQLVRMITVAAAALAIGAVAACGQADSVSGAPVSSETIAEDQVEPAAQSKAAGVTALAVVTTGELGQIVTDQDGRTLYRFDSDTAKPPKSNCDGDCAVAWPPALAPEGGEIAVEGVDTALVGTVDRADGTKQVTIAGWPAYQYVEDAAPGDIKGQGVGGKWFAFTPAGKKASAQGAAAAATVPLGVMKVGNLGEIVTNKDGMTLYRFDKDTKGQKSNCEGECATKWLPLLQPEGAQVQAQEIDPAALGTVVRADGSKQVTVGGWPLYLFSGDKVACDINGQGVGGTWFASTATGGKAGV